MPTNWYYSFKVAIYHNNITNVVSLIQRCKQGYKCDKGCCAALRTQWCEYISPLRTRSWREGWTHKVSPCLGAPSANVHWVSFSFYISFYCEYLRKYIFMSLLLDSSINSKYSKTSCSNIICIITTVSVTLHHFISWRIK